MSRPISAGLVIAISAAIAGAQEAPVQNAPPPEDVSLTVYSTADPAGFDPQQFIAQQRQGYNPYFAWQVPGYGVVKEVRPISLPNQRNIVRMTDVAEHIDPTTVTFVDLDHPASTAVIQQSFKFDLVSPAKLLQRYVDQTIQHVTPASNGVPEKIIRGRVLSVNQGQVVLQTDSGLQFIHANSAGIRLPKLPDGLITRPTLEWTVLSEVHDSPHKVRTTYQTRGLTWRSDYSVILNSTDTQADIGAWVTLMNLSGAAYPNAKLKLVAGDVQRITPDGGVRMRLGSRAGKAGADAGGFTEKSFFEYHLYTLPRRTDIPQNTTQQIALFPTASGVSVEKVLVYYGLPRNYWRAYGAQPYEDRNFGNQSNNKIDVYLQFENRESNRMGMPLPKGKLRVYKRDNADGTLEFIGEDLIDHTPRDERVQVRLGNTFDVVGERTQTDFKVERGRWIEEAFKIQIRNHKDDAVKVIVKENLYRWSNWQIVEQSDQFEKADFRTIHFPVQVPARGEKTITYRVKYTWHQ